MVFHIIIGFFCIVGFGRLIIVFKRLDKPEFDRSKTLTELVILFVFLFVSPLILTLFVGEN